MASLAKYRDKNWLYDQYVTQRKPAKQIAEECNVTHQTIVHYLDIHEIYRPMPKFKNNKE
jgi:hypothetical protein